MRTALRTNVVPVLRRAGFRGTFPTWRLERHGDVAVVNVQSGQYNEGTHGEFYVNLSVVPPSWWAWTHECAAQTMWGSDSKDGNAKESDGLYRGRLARLGGRGSKAFEWTVDSAEQAKTVSAAMARALEDGSLETMLDLMGPGRMLSAVRSGRIDRETPVQDRAGMRDMVEAVLLTEMGGPELEEVCQRLDQFAGRDFSDLPLATASWARNRARSMSLGEGGSR
jgi:hypothetical protein